MKKLILLVVMMFSVVSFGQRYGRTYYIIHYYPSYYHHSRSTELLPDFNKDIKNNLSALMNQSNDSLVKYNIKTNFKLIKNYYKAEWKQYTEEQLIQLKKEILESIYSPAIIENKIKNGLEIGIFSIKDLKILSNNCDDLCKYKTILNKYNN